MVKYDLRIGIFIFEIIAAADINEYSGTGLNGYQRDRVLNLVLKDFSFIEISFIVIYLFVFVALSYLVIYLKKIILLKMCMLYCLVLLNSVLF